LRGSSSPAAGYAQHRREHSGCRCEPVQQTASHVLQMAPSAQRRISRQLALPPIAGSWCH
jgi:hypothetical protein